jgi:hypothetical protein
VAVRLHDHTCVIDQDVDASVVGTQLLGEPTYGTQVGKIQLLSSDVGGSALSSDRTGRPFARCGIADTKYNACPGERESPPHLEPNASSAGHYR